MADFVTLYGADLDTELGSADRTVRFTTARRKEAVNKGLREFNRLTECFVRQASIALADNVAEYDLETVIAALDYIRLAKQGVEVKKLDAGGNATYFAGEDLPRRDIAWLNRYEPGWRTASKGIPIAHYLRDDAGKSYWGLYPPPSVGAGETWTGTIPYVAQPPDMVADGDVPYAVAGDARIALVPYHPALVHFAAAQLERLRKNRDGYVDQMQLFGGYVSDYLGTQKPRGGQHVTFARTYYRSRSGAQQDRPLARVRDPRRWP